MVAAVQIGSRLGRYEIVEELGQGGMSVVYRARDTQLERDVAVKVMHGFLAEQPEARERFHREAVAVARLRHPHIIEIFDYSGAEAQASYIVAELVRGKSLAELIRHTKIAPPEGALVLGRAVVDALAHAHRAGIIHRDLKPENILVDGAGSLKLTDFGIARMLDNETLTMTGTLLGSPAYMAPEYIEGEEPDERADIFSFGAMLYQLMVGELPFAGPSPHALLKRIASGMYTPANQANTRIHSAIARLVHKCLATQPVERYGSAALLLSDLDALLARLRLDPEAERPKLLADPAAYGAAKEAELVKLYFDLGKSELAAGRAGRAVDDFDRVLSIDPEHKQVKKILDRLARRRLVRRGLRALALGTAGAALITGFAALLDRPVPVATEHDVPAATTEPEQKNVVIAIHGRGDLSIDGKLVAKAVTDTVPVLLPVGSHRVEVLGERPFSGELVVPAAGPIAPFVIDVRPPSAPAAPTRAKSKVVSINPKTWVTLYVDDEAEPRVTKQSGKFDVTLTHGTHLLRYTNDFAKTREQTVIVSDSEPPGTLVVDLEPRDGKLRITRAPPGTMLMRVAGKDFLVTDRNRDEEHLVPLKTGREEHEIEITREGFAPFRKSVLFTPGQTSEIEVTLVPLGPTAAAP